MRVYVKLEGITAMRFGNPEQFILPTDSSGNTCGRNEKLNQPYLIYFDISACSNINSVTKPTFQCPTRQECVSSCPSVFWSYWSDVGSILDNMAEHNVGNETEETYSEKLSVKSTIRFANLPSLINVDDFICTEGGKAALTRVLALELSIEQTIGTINGIIGNANKYISPGDHNMGT